MQSSPFETALTEPKNCKTKKPKTAKKKPKFQIRLDQFSVPHMKLIQSIKIM